jgi:hypothetical protein
MPTARLADGGPVKTSENKMGPRFQYKNTKKYYIKSNKNELKMKNKTTQKNNYDPGG